MEFSCFLCNKSFTQKSSLIRHTKDFHGGVFECPNCNQSFPRYDNFLLHWKVCIHSLHLHEQNKNRKRLHSGGESEKESSPASGKISRSGDEELEERTPNYTLTESAPALEGVFKNYTVDLSKSDQRNDIFEVLTQGISTLKPSILQDLSQKLAIKIYVSLKLNFHLSIDTTYVTDPPVVFNTDPVSVLMSTDIERILEKIFETLTSKIETFSMQGSGWVLHKLLNLQLHVTEYQPLHGSVFTFRLPKEVYDKKQLLIFKIDVIDAFYTVLQLHYTQIQMMCI